LGRQETSQQPGIVRWNDPGFINLISTTLRAFGSINESAVHAGQSAATGGTPWACLFYSLRMKVREVFTFGGAVVPEARCSQAHASASL